MDDASRQLERSIGSMRARLDRDVQRLGRRASQLGDRAKAQAQWWGGISAVIAGTLGAIVFWPRRG